MKIEVRNETKKKLYVKLCKSMTGAFYLHIDDKKSEHIDILVKPEYYEIVEEFGVEDGW